MTEIEIEIEKLIKLQKEVDKQKKIIAKLQSQKLWGTKLKQ